ncbi:MAG: histidine phosphatase family protein [Phycisphaeraceae bacterium]
MRVYLIRHADPDYANDTITERGHDEARTLATHLRRVRIDHLYVSPLGRAQATAGYIAEAKTLAPVTLDWTRERGGWLIDQPHDNGTRMCIWDVHGHRVRGGAKLPGHDDWQAHPPFDHEAVRAEYPEIIAESDTLLAKHGYVRDGHVYRVERSNRDALAVVCHGGFGLTWLAHLLALPLPLVYSGFFMPPASVTTILFDERCPEVAVPRCIGLGLTAHRHDDRHVPIGIKANYE